MAFESARRLPSTLVSTLQSLIDRVIPPPTRQQIYASISTFASEQPLLASFILTLTLLTIFPLLLFMSFALTLLTLSLLSALVFSLFFISLSLLVLVPTLLLASTAAFFLWVWGVGSLITLRFVYNALYNLAGTPEIKAEVKTASGVTSVSTIPKDGGEPRVERRLDARAEGVKAKYEIDPTAFAAYNSGEARQNGTGVGA